MGCSRRQQRRQQALETRRKLRDEKDARLTKGCDAGDQRSCMELQNILQTEQFLRQNQFKPELHR